MRIAVMAAGGVGGFLAARLIKAGSDVAVIARGAHLAAIRENGLTLENPKERINVRPRIATDDPAAIGPVDILIFAVKMPDIETAAEACRPLIGPGTGVIPFQNGVEASDIIAGILGAEHAMMGTTYIFSDIVEPGRIVQTGTNARFFFGERTGGQSERSNAFRASVLAAGVDAPVPADIRLEIWRKFVFLSSMAGITAATRAPIGEIRADPVMRATYTRAMEEVAAVAKARGIELPADSMDRYAHYFDSAPYEARSTLAKDLAAGRPLEVEWLSGAVHRLGKESGVDTPVHSTFYAVLRPFAQGRRG
jgi:2-dehydropantoate 2-reductase